MSLPTVSFFNLPRNQVPSDDQCYICLLDTKEDGEMLWVAHKDVTNRNPECQSNLIHPIHKRCAEKTHHQFAKCCGQDVNVDVDSLSRLANKSIDGEDISDEVRTAIRYKENVRDGLVSLGLLALNLAVGIAVFALVVFMGGLALIAAYAVVGAGFLCALGLADLFITLGVDGTKYNILKENEDEFISYIASSLDRYSQFKNEGISNLSKDFAETLNA